MSITHSPSAGRTDAALDAQRSAVWIERGGLKVKVVAGTPQAEVDAMIAQAVAAAERLQAAAPTPSTSSSGAREHTVGARIERLLRDQGPLTGGELADELDQKRDTVRKALDRGAAAGRFYVRRRADGPAAWELVGADES